MTHNQIISVCIKQFVCINIIIVQVFLLQSCISKINYYSQHSSITALQLLSLYGKEDKKLTSKELLAALESKRSDLRRVALLLSPKFLKQSTKNNHLVEIIEKRGRKGDSTELSLVLRALRLSGRAVPDDILRSALESNDELIIAEVLRLCGSASFKLIPQLIHLLEDTSFTLFDIPNTSLKVILCLFDHSNEESVQKALISFYSRIADDNSFYEVKKAIRACLYGKNSVLLRDYYIDTLLSLRKRIEYGGNQWDWIEIAELVRNLEANRNDKAERAISSIEEAIKKRMLEIIEGYSPKVRFDSLESVQEAIRWFWNRDATNHRFLDLFPEEVKKWKERTLRFEKELGEILTVLLNLPPKYNKHHSELRMISSWPEEILQDPSIHVLIFPIITLTYDLYEKTIDVLTSSKELGKTFLLSLVKLKLFSNAVQYESIEIWESNSLLDGNIHIRNVRNKMLQTTCSSGDSPLFYDHPLKSNFSISTNAGTKLIYLGASSYQH